MRYKLNEEKFFSDITDNIAVIIGIDTGTYYGLNELTTNVYENIISGVDTDEILLELKKIVGYDLDIDSKYNKLIDDLIKEGIIIECEKKDAKPVIKFDKFNNEKNDFILSEFKDAEELLLADPIHQVKEDEGWKPDKGILK